MISKIFYGACFVLILAIIAMYFVIEDRRQAVSLLNGVANVANQGAPRQVDEKTILNGVSAHNFQLLFNFTIVGGLDSYDRNAHIQSVKNSFQATGCSSPKIRDGLLTKGVEFVYQYYSEVGDMVASFRFDIRSCKNFA